jgi:hypothetical protein
MSEAGPADGFISRADIEELAVLFDRFEFALDPTSEDCKVAEVELEDRVRAIFLERVSASYPSISYTFFRCKVRTQCRTYLRKN